MAAGCINRMRKWGGLVYDLKSDVPLTCPCPNPVVFESDRSSTKADKGYARGK
jgi:hypothetical protein